MQWIAVTLLLLFPTKYTGAFHVSHQKDLINLSGNGLVYGQKVNNPFTILTKSNFKSKHTLLHAKEDSK